MPFSYFSSPSLDLMMRTNRSKGTHLKIFLSIFMQSQSGLYLYMMQLVYSLMCLDLRRALEQPDLSRTTLASMLAVLHPAVLLRNKIELGR